MTVLATLESSCQDANNTSDKRMRRNIVKMATSNDYIKRINRGDKILSSRLQAFDSQESFEEEDPGDDDFSTDKSTNKDNHDHINYKEKQVSDSMHP